MIYKKDQILTDSKEHCGCCPCMGYRKFGQLEELCYLFNDVIEYSVDEGEQLRLMKCKKRYPNGMKIIGL